MEVNWHHQRLLQFWSVGRRKKCVRSEARRPRPPLSCEPLESRQLLASDLVISELMASNSSSLLDEDRDTSDWIEIHNPTESSVDLTGWTISDDADQLNKWTFPSVSIQAGAFLVVFASGKDRRAAAEELHTNFKLAKSGEFLALGRPDGITAHQFAPGYPSQQTDISFGLDANDAATTGFMTTPTPGAANEQVFLGFASDSSISVAGGIFDQSFDVRITSEMPDAVIRYTTDGSAPTDDNGEVYSGPITISATTTLRARSTKPEHVPGAIETSTYLFLENVLQQTQPEDYPNLRSGDYDVDPVIALSAQYNDRLLDGLKAIPSLSLVLPPDDFFGRRGIYMNSEARGANWERATSVELIYPDGVTHQIDAGIRIQGGASRSPSTTPKHSFSLRFRDRYGDGPLEYSLFDNSPVEHFTSLSLRGGSNNSWTSNNAVERRNAQSIRDQWIRDALIAMGHPDSGRGSYVHVYVNGLYWGLYNLTERPDAEHYAAYFGGNADSLDAFNGNQVIDGSQEALQEMKAIAATGDLSALQTVLDLDRYIDYTILNRYGSNGDLDITRNYRLAGGGRDRAPWRVYPWDSEEVLINAGSSGRPTDPVGLRNHIEEHPEFMVRFGDRLQKHLFNGGALTPEVTAELWNARAEEIDLAIIGETARWGDHRRPDRPYTRDDDWLNEQNRLYKDYFPRRSDVLISLYRSEGLFPSIDAPNFNEHGGVIADDFGIDLSAAIGTIYYTTDGSDPRLSGGAVADTAQVFTATLRLTDDTTIKTRCAA